MQVTKKQKRLKRAKKTRVRIKEQGKPRLVVNRTNKHIYAQLIQVGDNNSDVVVVSASTLDKEVTSGADNVLPNAETAKKIGALVASRAVKKDIKSIAFDRSGFKYHGCIKALADSARESGLLF